MSDPQNPGGEAMPSEEELRAAYEAELERITALDMIAQAAVSLLNIGARRMGAPAAPGDEGGAADPSAGGRDLEQVRDAIDAASGLLAVLERRMPREIGPLKDALSRLQMAYAQEVSSAGAGAPPQGEPQPAGSQRAEQPSPEQPSSEQPAGQQGERRPGPAESSGRLWVPGS